MKSRNPEEWKRRRHHRPCSIFSVLVLMIVLLICHLSEEGCHGLAATGRQKRRQRGLAQQGVTTINKEQEQGSGEGQEEQQEVVREILWGMAGQTGRRKRQRGQKSTQDLREDQGFLAAVMLADPSTTTTVSSKANKTIRGVDPLNLVKPEDIEKVQVMVPSLTHTDDDDDIVSPPNILAEVTFVNGTILRGIHPRDLHQRDDNAIWMALRKSLDVTASELSAIAGNSVFTTREKLAQVKAGLLETTFTGNMKACEWGLKMEPKALRQYCQVTGNGVNETGLHIRPLSDDELAMISSNGTTSSISIISRPLLLGASPDGLVMDSKDGSLGLLEIKSLWGRRHKKELPQFDHCPQRFFDQIQGQLAVCDLDWCDLMMYIPPQTSLKKNRRGATGGAQKNYCILRVHRDRAYWSETLLPAIQSFAVEVDQLRRHGGNITVVAREFGESD